ncbi:GNAT family N-acetyltransferase [Arthrobacter roseus]|uniref:GNAT family N-acetyltransferase n=1 Tax=Arthrobacter roseus TaxID=136274 RepID=UPI001964B158|nr:spore coat polysaccharide biosynthesis predicted glycosyltransferase SpsG/RimJ/RimL family protein N-acetyltransferase [Arthrobacter roseus]
MIVLFRCDATKRQGLGHLIRSIAVADAASDVGWEVVFYGLVENTLGKTMLQEQGYLLHSWRGTAAEFASLAVDHRATVVHVDSYDDAGPLDTELAQRGILLSSVEDGHYGRRSAAIAIDPSPMSEHVYRPDDGSRHLLRGTKAIPLRRSILSAAKDTAKATVGIKVLVIMGGTDALNMTGEAVRLLLATGISCTCHVVAESAVLEPQPEVARQIVIHEPGPNIPSLFPSMDLVISGAGTTVWELATLGVPMALLQVVENQADNYRYAVGAGFALGLGSVRDGSLKAPEAATQLRELLVDPLRRAEMGAAGRHQVDGSGAARIVRVWAERLRLDRGLQVRFATLEDASRLFDWRNDPSVRLVSRATGELDWNSHVAWVEASVVADHRRLLIVEIDREPAATVRFDRLDENQATEGETWEVSITLSPAHRGRGMAGSVLAMAEDYFLNHQAVALLIAEMLEDNIASYNLFSAGGYRPDEDAELAAIRRPWRRLVKAVTTAVDPR